MPSKRKVSFQNGAFYHVFNRGVNKSDIFLNVKDYRRGLNTLNYYKYVKPKIRYSDYIKLSKEKMLDYILEHNNSPKHVEVHAYCLLGNHFHLLLKQITDGGITKFMSQFSNSYTKYINTKHTRSGPLFTGLFKAVYVADDEQLMHLSRYIHLNPFEAKLVDKSNLINYFWSSFKSYASADLTDPLIETSFILDLFGGKRSEYKKFVFKQIPESEVLLADAHIAIEK